MIDCPAFKIRLIYNFANPLEQVSGALFWKKLMRKLMVTIKISLLDIHLMRYKI